jgi:uncharacterized protein YgiM (DUF1202 family)
MNKLVAFVRILSVLAVVALFAPFTRQGRAAQPDADASPEPLFLTVPTRTFTPEPTLPPSPTVPSPTATRTPAVTPTLPAPSPSTSTPTAPTPTPAIVANEDTSVYSGPGADYSVIGLLKAGESAIVVGRNADSTWWQIRFQADRAWVSAAAVTASLGAYSVPVVSAPPLGTAGATPVTLPRAGGASALWNWVLLLIAGSALLVMSWRRRRAR